MLISGCQSRTISRFTGSALELNLPDDFDKPISLLQEEKGKRFVLLV